MRNHHIPGKYHQLSDLSERKIRDMAIEVCTGVAFKAAAIGNAPMTGLTNGYGHEKAETAASLLDELIKTAPFRSIASNSRSVLDAATPIASAHQVPGQTFRRTASFPTLTL